MSVTFYLWYLLGYLWYIRLSAGLIYSVVLISRRHETGPDWLGRRDRDLRAKKRGEESEQNTQSFGKRKRVTKDLHILSPTGCRTGTLDLPTHSRHSHYTMHIPYV